MDYNKYISKRVLPIKFSGIRKYFDVVSTMKDGISLGVGEPDFETPESIREEGIRVLKAGGTKYTSNAGLLELRESIASYLKLRWNMNYTVDEIVVTVGGSEAIDITVRTLVDAGDEVIIPEPSYVSYSPCVELCGGIPVPVPCTEENNFKVTREQLEKVITKKTKAIILPYPNNPTGAIMTKEDLEQIAPLLIENDVIAITDEVYGELTYNGKTHTSIACIDGMWERTVVINSFSKGSAMTGWRLGYLCAPDELARQILKIHQYVIMCAPTVSQYAGVVSMKNGEETNYADTAAMRAEYDKRRRYLIDTLNRIGLHCFEAEGAFYAFPSVASLGMTGEEFADRLLEEEQVAVVPGNAFGESGANHVRISYAYSLDTLKKAMERIERFVNKVRSEKITG